VPLLGELAPADEATDSLAEAGEGATLIEGAKTGTNSGAKLAAVACTEYDHCYRSCR
jgi:hypothetical protein